MQLEKVHDELVAQIVTQLRTGAKRPIQLTARSMQLETVHDELVEQIVTQLRTGAKRPIQLTARSMQVEIGSRSISREDRHSTQNGSEATDSTHSSLNAT